MSMKACFLLLVLVLAAPQPQSILFSEALRITEYLDYSVLHTDELPEDLSTYNVIVISTPLELYEEHQIQSLKTFVESGGGLMLLAEENNMNGTTLVMNQIAEEFSITFNSDRIYDNTLYVDHTSWVLLKKFPPHPVFQGITNVVYTSGCSVEGEGLAIKSSEHAFAEKYDGVVTYIIGEFPPCMVFSELGKGRIFACGDKELFDTYLSLEDNTLFALNIFDWLAGNPDRISKRFADKEKALQTISETESALHTAIENGLKELFLNTVTNVETLLSEAKNLYEVYQFAAAHQKAVQAAQTLISGQDEAQEMVDSRIQAAEQCLSKIEKGAKEYLPSQFEAAHYYLQQVDQEKTYAKKMEKADKALELCEEINTSLEGAAEKEINLATEKVSSFKGLFGRKSHHSARIYLEYAEESYDKENFGDALVYAEQSQIYSDRASKEQKKDYILVAGIGLLVVFVGYIYVRKWR